MSRTRHSRVLLMLRCGVLNRRYTEQSLILNPEFCARINARTQHALDKSERPENAHQFDSD